MNSPLTANLEERIDDTTLQRMRHEVTASESEPIPDSTAPAPRGRVARFLEETLAKRLGHRNLVQLAAHRGRASVAWRALPERMHLVANQTKLIMELIDDFRSGRYRVVPWHSLAIGAAAMLYVANPADVVPDWLAGLGILDDIAVAAFAANALRKDLIEYCKSKGYKVEEYFAPA